MVKQDLGKEDDMFMKWNWDLQKACDLVERENVFEEACRQGYPMDIMRTSLVSYGWEKRFVLNTEVPSVIRSHRGIAASTLFAP